MAIRDRTLCTDPDLKKTVDAALRKMRQVVGFSRVRFIILYGSAAEGHMTSDSDIDLCIDYNGPRDDASRFRHAVLSLLSSDRIDVQVFQLLPLYVRVEILKGIPVFVQNRRALYETADRTLREFADFRHRLHDYTGQAALP